MTSWRDKDERDMTRCEVSYKDLKYCQLGKSFQNCLNAASSGKDQGKYLNIHHIRPSFTFHRF